ncbi:MAG: class I SAM-dependent methyltransferase [Acidobacteriota bacterium]
MSSPLKDSRLEALLDRLRIQNDAQGAETQAYISRRLQEGTLDLNRFKFDDDMHRFYSDKMVILDRDKAEFCYLLCRALKVARVVEAGTSFGVSTLYLAAAVRDNQIENGVVIATEYEPKKAAIARENFEEAGLGTFIELREGDLRETLKEIQGPVDFMLIDVWEVALPALKLISPRLRSGAIVVCDNTAIRPEYYRDYFEFVRDPGNRFSTMTMPFGGGLEITVRV